MTPITILYGSETGNAEDYARLLYKKLHYLQLKPTLAPLDEYPLKKLVTDTEVLIIICSTTGQGEMPRNARSFWKFLRKRKLPPDLFNHLHVTTLGLGDSSYPKFNLAVRKIHARLVQLGSRELSPRCEADDMAPEGPDGFYSEWEKQVIQTLAKRYAAVQLDDDVLLPAENPLVVTHETVPTSKEIALRRPGVSVGRVVSNQRITSADHFQDVRHIVLEADGLEYMPGDTVALYPSNNPRHVDLLFELQPHWLPYADKKVIINGKPPPIEGGFIPEDTLTLRLLLTHHLDLVAIPRRTFFMLLHHFTDASTEDGAREKAKLKDFCNFAESEELYNYANRPRRSILETILEFDKNTRIPVEYVLDLFPLIKPRLFSIASRPNQALVELVVALVEYKTKLRRIRRGLCSTYLKGLEVGAKVPYTLHRQNLTFGENEPIIMISPGTGIAPMKSLIEQEAGHRPLHLFFGCRYRSKDYLFQQLWEDLERKGLLHLYPAFSRDNDKYKYVQHRLFSEWRVVGDLLINQGALVYVCGSSGAMPREVRLTLVEILDKSGHPSPADFLVSLENSGRYIQETW